MQSQYGASNVDMCQKPYLGLCKSIIDRLIKFAEAKKRHDSLPSLARELLSDGEVIAATAEGVVVELPHEIFAHVSRDGSVDMMAPQCGQAQNFADDIQGLVQRIGEERLTRSSVLGAARAAHTDVQSHVPEATASSSNDVDESESLGDVIAHLAKEHAKRAQQGSSRASSSAGGGAPPPNDPRNNRNNWRPNISERVTEKVSNMKEFFDTPFGQTLKGKVQKTNYTYDNQAVYQVTEKIPHSELKKKVSIFI